MYNLPTELEIGGVEYSIRNRGDYRTVLDIFSILEDPDLDKAERIICALIVFYEDIETIEDVYSLPDVEEAVNQMFKFFDAGKPDGQVKSHRKLIDWQGDEAMIISAINNVAGKEVRAEKYLHWYTFMSYYMSVGESILSTVVSIREKVSKGKHLEKWERQFRTENPQYFKWNSKTADEMDAENWVMSVWNKE